MISNCAAMDNDAVCGYSHVLKDVYTFNIGTKTGRGLDEETNGCLVNNDVTRIVSFDTLAEDALFNARKIDEVRNLVDNKICVISTDTPTPSPTVHVPTIERHCRQI